MTTKSEKIFEQACKLMPGGVSSPVRAYRAVKGLPPVIRKAEGSRIEDEDGRSYIDYVGSWGAALVGHAHPEVLEAVQSAVVNGLSFGAPTLRENQLAEKLISAFPAMEQIRFVSTGTEACMSAIRLARGYTQRGKIVKFDGHYHGHADCLLAKAGSGVITLGLPDSPGVQAAATQDTLIVPFNDIAAAEAVFQEHGDDIAAVIVEPVAGNCGMIPPVEGYLQALRRMTENSGSLLIFDEVMTGFRVAWGGAQVLYDIRPDLTSLAKVIGGGMPLAAYGGRKEIMQCLAPVGPVYQAGTLSGNPVATACGLKTLEVIEKNVDYSKLQAYGEKFISGLKQEALAVGHMVQGQAIGGMMGFCFSKIPVHSYEDASKNSQDVFQTFFHGMLKRGVYLAPSAFEAGFISLAHNQADLEETLAAIRATFQEDIAVNHPR
ncbi:MAG: glutamate-1-semialdehyde 2,1-aminomutase [Oligoflexales bacterium]